MDWNGNGREGAGDWYMDYEIMNDNGGGNGGGSGNGTGDGCAGCLLIIIAVVIILSIF